MTYTETKNSVKKSSILTVAALSAILFASVPSYAHATLVGDDVTIELVGGEVDHDPDGVSSTKTKTVTQGLGAEFLWQGAEFCPTPDEQMEIDIESDTISVFLADNQGVFCVWDSTLNPIDNPMTFQISSLDWIDAPDAVVDGISVISNPLGLTTTQQVTGDDSVEISIDVAGQLSLSSTTIVFQLEKRVFDAEKSWTHTDYNWDEVCDGFINATGFCVVSEEDDTEIGFRPANINVDDVLADKLDQDGDDKYLAFAQVHKNDKFSNTNPGAFYALTTVDVNADLDGITVLEDYSACTDSGNGILDFVSKKETRNVKVAVADPNGDVTELTDDLYDGVGGSIVADIDDATVTITDSIDNGSTVYVLVKFQDNLKGADAPNGEFDEECMNSESISATIGQDNLDDTVDAVLRITNLE